MESMRDKINEFFLGRNTIDTLLTKQVEDYTLIQEFPFSINVFGKKLWVGNYNLENERNFICEWGLIISNMTARILNMEISDDRRKDLLEKGNFSLLANGAYLLEFLLMDRWLEKKLCKLLKHTLFEQQKLLLEEYPQFVHKKELCSFSYFKKHINKELICQICWLIYKYNFDSVKKNLKLIVEKMNMKQLSETYIPFWLKNSGGLTGKFLIAQAPSVDYVFRDVPNKTSGKKRQKKSLKEKDFEIKPIMSNKRKEK